MVEDVIRENTEKINTYKRELEALKEFKRSVGTAKDGFYSVNRDKKSILSNLDAVKAESKTAALYQKGMRESLTGIGEGVVSIAFLGLGFSVQMKINDYDMKIKALETENLALSAIDQ